MWSKKKRTSRSRRGRSCRNANGAFMVALVPFGFSKALERFILEPFNGLYEPHCLRTQQTAIIIRHIDVCLCHEAATRSWLLVNAVLNVTQTCNESRRRLKLLVEDPGQVKVKSAFWLLFKPVGIVGRRYFRVAEITERDPKVSAGSGHFWIQWR